jgi:hypothetical protein
MFIAMLAFAAPTFAHPGNGHGNGNGHGKGNPHNAFNGDDQGDDRDGDRWERRGDYEYRTYDKDDGLPPGWSKGKKKGWGNCGMPPGQAKKHGCQSYTYQGREYDYYHDDSGHIVVRRPSIHIDGGAIDVH